MCLFFRALSHFPYLFYNWIIISFTYFVQLKINKKRNTVETGTPTFVNWISCKMYMSNSFPDNEFHIVDTNYVLFPVFVMLNANTFIQLVSR